MTVVLAALDHSPHAATVLAAAKRLGELADCATRAIHIPRGPTEAVEWIARQAGVDLEIADGPIADTLADAIATPDVVAAVLGTRGVVSGRRRSLGTNASRVIATTTKPVLLVPADAPDMDRAYRRLLVPLEGNLATSSPIVDTLCPLIIRDVELVVLHVFTETTIPLASDRPGRDLAMWGTEFLARFCPNASRIELRTGSIASQVNRLCRQEDVDVIVLSWAQDDSAGRAAVVRDVLAAATVPVLLIPSRTGVPAV